MSNSLERSSTHLADLNEIDIDDLRYVEEDLCFHELVSLGFLLYGEERTNAEFILQKLYILSHNPAMANGASLSAAVHAMVPSADLLRRYATNVNKDNWRPYLVEALAIIGARRVLRKLGFQWEELRQHYLPHIAELSLNINPVLKALYKICERLTPAEAGRLVLQINDRRRNAQDYLKFYDFSYLEVFLLDWITRRLISVGNRDHSGIDVDILLEYFKQNDMESMKKLLLDTINSNTDRIETNKSRASHEGTSINTLEDSATASDASGQAAGIINSSVSAMNANPRESPSDPNENYRINRDQAGIVLIINQQKFYKETNEKWKHLLPKKPLEEREGTDVDKNKLRDIFSSFGYMPLIYENVSHLDMLHNIRDAVKRSILFDSLIVCILSHGIDGNVYGSNSIPVEIAQIEQIITADTLLDKPKMLIIQACQDSQSTTIEHNSGKRTNLASSDPTAYTDMIKAMSTVAGFSSLRHTDTGSWFIQSLCFALDKYGNSKHILDILTIVIREVSQKRGDRNEQMVPQTTTTLRKPFYLPRRTNASNNNS